MRAPLSRMRSVAAARVSIERQSRRNGERPRNARVMTWFSVSVLKHDSHWGRTLRSPAPPKFCVCMCVYTTSLFIRCVEERERERDDAWVISNDLSR